MDTLVISIVNKNKLLLVVYFETIKRELNKRLIYECRCDERLKVKPERSSRLTYTVARGTGTPKDRDEVNRLVVTSAGIPNRL